MGLFVMARKVNSRAQRRAQEKKQSKAQREEAAKDLIDRVQSDKTALKPEQIETTLKWLDDNTELIPPPVLQNIQLMLGLSNVLFNQLMEYKTRSSKLSFLVAMGIIPASERSRTARRRARSEEDEKSM